MCNYSPATLSAERIAKLSRIAANKSIDVSHIAHECESMHSAVRDSIEDYSDARLVNRCARIALLINSLDTYASEVCAILSATISAAVKRATARALSECAE